MPELRRESILDTINALNRVPSVTGFEDPFVRAVRRIASANDLPTRNIERQLLIGYPASRYLLVAHGDRVGFVANLPETPKQDAVIRLFYILRKMPSNVVLKRFAGTMLRAFDRTSGRTLFYGKLLDDNANDSLNLRISRLCTSAMPSGPVPICPAHQPLHRSRARVRGILDNTCGVAIGLTAVALMPNTFKLLITRQEEGPGWRRRSGRGGVGFTRYVRAHDLRTLVISLDARPAVPKRDLHRNVASNVESGLVIRSRETRGKGKEKKQKTILRADGQLRRLVLKVAARQGIRTQDWRGRGITELGRGAEALSDHRRQRLRAVWIQIPVLGNHTAVEVGNVRDIANAVRLLLGLGSLDPRQQANASTRGEGELR